MTAANFSRNNRNGGATFASKMMEQKKESKKVLFELDASLCRRLTHFCKLTGKTKKCVISTALKQYLDQQNSNLPSKDWNVI